LKTNQLRVAIVTAQNVEPGLGDIHLIPAGNAASGKFVEAAHMIAARVTLGVADKKVRKSRHHMELLEFCRPAWFPAESKLTREIWTQKMR
jgi:hypothetical protein